MSSISEFSQGSSPDPLAMPQEQDVTEELRNLMHTPPPPEADMSEVSDNDGPASAEALTDGSHSTRQAACRHEVAKACRHAIHLKLALYQHDLLVNMAKETETGRQLAILAQQYHLENRINAIIMATPDFTVSDALAETIKGYVIGILLSTNLSAYKGTIPRERVMALIKHYKVNVPQNFEQNQHVLKEIRHTVANELTQARSQIKKSIRASIDDDNESTSIFDLAIKVIANVRCTVTVPLCVRLALLRRVYSEDRTDQAKYWDDVDKHLVLIRETATQDPEKITRVFKSYLIADQKKYGDATSYTIAEESNNAWQQSLDHIVAGKTELQSPEPNV